MSLKKINDIHKKKEQFIKLQLDELDSDVITLQDKLLKMLVRKYFGEFYVEDGQIVINSKNIALIYSLDKIFDDYLMAELEDMSLNGCKINTGIIKNNKTALIRIKSDDNTFHPILIINWSCRINFTGDSIPYFCIVRSVTKIACILNHRVCTV
jgi:hypothetical protein